MPPLLVNKLEVHTRRALLLAPGALIGSCIHGAPARQIPGVTLDCGIELASSRLRVAYSVRNKSSSEIGVMTGDYYIDVDGSTLKLEIVVLPVPTGLQTAGQPIPYVIRLGPGQIHKAEFSMTEPVAVNNPYRRAQLAARTPGSNITANRRHELRDVMFSIGVFEAGANLRFNPEPGAGAGLCSVWPPGAAIDKQVILTKKVTLSIAVSVLDY